MSNLQKYHVSKNLFDVPNFTYSVGSGSQNRQLWTGNLPVGTYTVSINQEFALTSSIRNTFMVTINGTAYYESTAANYHNDAGLHIMTFNVSEGDVVTINYWAHTLSDNCTFSNAMLNLGSIVLPYEPYSTDVWHDLASQQYINGVFVDNANIPEKYSGSWG